MQTFIEIIFYDSKGINGSLIESINSLSSISNIVRRVISHLRSPDEYITFKLFRQSIDYDLNLIFPSFAHLYD